MIAEILHQILNQTDLTESSHAIARELVRAMSCRKEISISGIAESAGVSKAMVTKFSGLLGYRGFTKLKDAYQEWLPGSSAISCRKGCLKAEFLLLSLMISCRRTMRSEIHLSCLCSGILQKDWAVTAGFLLRKDIRSGLPFLVWDSGSSRFRMCLQI